ncbi:amino acid synthesis family protein [Aciditerrimonas ferrireducens]|uniref:Amino acid synthesis family protein n=1 Tax=Aciditerrimonas ferrireducens TaxID=667306 RepID=A0ABV6C060_9ACTN
MLTIRKVQLVVEEVRLAAGRPGLRPLRKVAALAVVSNPLAGQGFVEDLSPLIEPSAALGEELGTLAREALGDEVQSYGKAAICGTAGEQEHANACLTSTFGDAFRKAVGGGLAWITSTTKVGGPGCAIDVPLAYKDELWVRSHYDAVEVRVPDAPLADELVVIAAVANRGRLHARLGGLSLEEARTRLEAASGAAEGAA